MVYNVNDNDESDFIRLLASKELRDYYTNFIHFKENLAQRSDLAQFWLSFLEVIEILLNRNYATSSGNWNLHVESLRSTLPWLIAYDRTNYSRYLTAHNTDVLALENRHSDLYNDFQKGQLLVQISEKNTFGRMEADKVIETTINRDTKTPGGTRGEAKFNQAYIACLNNLLHILINKFLLSPTHFLFRLGCQCLVLLFSSHLELQLSQFKSNN